MENARGEEDVKRGVRKQDRRVRRSILREGRTEGGFS